MAAAAEESRRACRVRVAGRPDKSRTEQELPGRDVAERPVSRTGRAGRIRDSQVRQAGRARLGAECGDAEVRVRCHWPASPDSSASPGDRVAGPRSESRPRRRYSRHSVQGGTRAGPVAARPQIPVHGVSGDGHPPVPRPTRAVASGSRWAVYVDWRLCGHPSRGGSGTKRPCRIRRTCPRAGDK